MRWHTLTGEERRAVETIEAVSAHDPAPIWRFRYRDPAMELYAEQLRSEQEEERRRREPPR